MNYPLLVLSHSILTSFNGSLDHTNIGITVGFLLISCLEAELQRLYLDCLEKFTISGFEEYYMVMDMPGHAIFGPDILRKLH